MTPTITDGLKQTVITRLATINSAIALLDLTTGKPAAVTVEDVLATAGRIEHWAWRGLAIVVELNIMQDLIKRFESARSKLAERAAVIEQLELRYTLDRMKELLKL